MLSGLRHKAVLGLMVLLAAAGWSVAEWRAKVKDSDMRDRLLRQAAAVARTIDPEQVRQLSFTEEDRTSPILLRLHEQMASYRPLAHCRGTYTVALRNEKIVFGPESYGESDPQASQPGTIYEQPTPRLSELFKTATPFTEGPYTDEYGTFVSAFTPVLDPRTGGVLLAVGMDIEANEWQATINRERLIVGLYMLVLAIILLGGAFALGWRDRLSPDRQGRLRHAEAYLVAAMGLSLTFIAAATFHNNETRSRQAMFTQLAEIQTNRVVETFTDLRENQLGSLVRFYEGSETVGRDEFHAFAGPIVRQNDLQAMEWVPSVAAIEKETFEAQARAEGIKDFAIWQKGADGQRESAGERESYYPVWFVEPVSGNEAAMGYDLGSEPVRRTALEMALDTGLAVATEPITLVQGKGKQTGMLVFHPVFSRERETREFRGFALAVLRPDSMLKTASSSNGVDDDTSLVVSLLHLQGDRAPRLMASSQRGDLHRLEDGGGEPAMLAGGSGPFDVFPLFAFGKCYALTVQPGRSFLINHPAQAGRISFLVGLLLTVVLTSFTAFLTRRQADLEAKVQLRTAALQESDARHRLLFEKSPEAYLILDDGVFIDCNDAALTMLRATRNQVIGQEPRKLSPERQPDGSLSSDRAAALIRDALQTGAVRFEWQFRRLDGTQLRGDVSLVMMPIAGRPRLLVAWRDITERQRAEEELRRSEERFRIVAEATGQLIYDWDIPSGRILWSGSLQAIIGFTLDEMNARGIGGWEELVHPQDRAQVVAALDQARQTRTDFICEYRLRKADGTYIHVSDEGTFLLDEEGKAARMLGVIKNVTERKKAEEELRLANTILRTQQETSLDGILVANENGRIVLSNQRFAEMWNIPADVLATGEDELVLQMTMSQVTDRATHESTVRRLNERCNEKSYHEVVLTSGLTYERHSAPMFGPDGQYYGRVWYFRDITEARRAEAALRETNRSLKEATEQAQALAEEAAQANAAKSEFLANMSHEIRTPMTAILGYADLISEGCPEDCAQGGHHLRDSIATIRRNGEHLLALINDVLDLSKIEAKKMTTEQVACSPYQIVAEVASLVRVRATAKDLEFDIEFIGPIPETIRTDPLRLRQILVNLLGNAIKFTETGGVRLLIRMAEDGEPHMQFDVIDTGIGMTQEQAGRLFRAFGQADTSTTRQFGGTGLGLVISQRLAQLLGGDVVIVDTQPGLGTRFRLTVATGPLDGVRMVEGDSIDETLFTRHRAAAETSNSTIQAKPLAGLRILLAEDGPDNQRLITHLLKKAGAAVTVVENGREAVDAAMGGLRGRRESDPAHSFDLILMDMQMPEMDGYEATRRLRAADYHGPIIALTAHAMDHDRRRCLNAGCNDYASKPIDMKKLIETIHRRIRGADVEAGTTSQ